MILILLLILTIIAYYGSNKHPFKSFLAAMGLIFIFNLYTVIKNDLKLQNEPRTFIHKEKCENVCIDNK